MGKQVRVAILGASGYTGAEAVRLLARHPVMSIAALTAERKAGQSLAEAFPHLGFLGLPDLVALDAVDWDGIDAVLCALPHATTQAAVRDLPRHVRIADVSADFRLDDASVYRDWYAHDHGAPELQREAVYGLTEFARARIAGARLVACPGCYPTTALLALVPLIEAGLIDPDEIIIDAKSGVSGAGRAEKQASLHTEVSEGLHAYGVGRHRHMPEIDQELSKAAGRAVTATFTPHLMPMNRGILATIYVRVRGGGPQALHGALAARFNGEPFVHVLPFGETPATRHVRGSNHAMIGIAPDRRPDRAIVVCVLDNLVKGASGQAIQNLNLMFGLPETAGLEQLALFP